MGNVHGAFHVNASHPRYKYVVSGALVREGSSSALEGSNTREGRQQRAHACARVRACVRSQCSPSSPATQLAAQQPKPPAPSPKHGHSYSHSHTMPGRHTRPVGCCVLQIQLCRSSPSVTTGSRGTYSKQGYKATVYRTLAE